MREIPESIKVKDLSGASLKGRLLVLLTNIRLGWQVFSSTNVS